jgi:ATP-dependent DNA ligase
MTRITFVKRNNPLRIGGERDDKLPFTKCLKIISKKHNQKPYRPPIQPLFPSVMDARTYDESKVKFPCCVQPKFDGCRIRIVHWKHGKIYVMSGNNKLRDSWVSLEVVAFGIIPEGYMLEGEFYCRHDIDKGHGDGQPISWQTLNGMFRRKANPFKENDVCIYAFDLIPLDGEMKAYGHRLKELYDRITQYKQRCPNVVTLQIIPNKFCKNMDEVETLYREYIAKGYEGMIVRDMKAGYEPNIRSWNVMKRKPMYDDEYEVKDIVLEENCLKVVCKDTESDAIFSAIWHMSKKEVEEKYNKRHLYIGKCVCVQYHVKTERGIPRSGLVKGIRYDKEEQIE